MRKNVLDMVFLICPCPMDYKKIRIMPCYRTFLLKIGDRFYFRHRDWITVMGKQVGITISGRGFQEIKTSDFKFTWKLADI